LILDFISSTPNKKAGLKLNPFTNLMRKNYLLSFLIVFNTVLAVAQNVSYTSLYDNAAFDGRAILQTLPVGSTPGAGNVSGNGGASYSIPIAVPPGTNGIVPSVSIEYNSQGGSGIAGMGWNINRGLCLHRPIDNELNSGKVLQKDVF